MQSQIEENRGVASDGIAIALASNVPSLSNGQSKALSVAFGHFDGSSAFAVSGATRVENTNMSLFGSAGVGTRTGKFGVSAGVQWSW